MSLRRKPNGIWFADVYAASGERIRKSSRTRDEAKAREWYAKLLNDLWRQRQLGERARRTWDEAVVAYMKAKEGSASYDSNLTRIARLHPELGGWYLVDIDRKKLNEVKRWLAESLKPGTVNRYLSFVLAVLNYAADEMEWIERAPKVKKADVPASDVEFLTPEEAERLIVELQRLARTRHLVKFVSFALATGLRMRNVTRLEWSQIDMQRRCMWVRAVDSKSRKPIPVPLTAQAIAVLRSQMGQHLERVFTFRGKPYERVNSRTLHKAAARAGIQKRVHPHLFRHTFASWHVMSGTSLQELKELGGWSKLESVLIYAHLSSAHLARAAENTARIGHTLTKLVEASASDDT